MRQEVLFLLVNLILYVFAFLRFKSHSLLGIGSIVFLLYGFLAAMSLLMVTINSGTHYSINLFALFYLYICILITYIPLSKFNNTKLELISPNRKALNIVVIIISLFSLYRFPEIISNFNLVITGFLADSNVFYDTYITAMESYTQVQNKTSLNILVIITSMLDGYIPFFLMYYLSLNKRNTFIVIGLLLGLLIAPMYGLINAQRGVLVDVVLATVLAYSLFKNYYNDRVIKRVRLIGVTFVAGVFFSLLMITVSRFGQSYMDTEEVQNSVYSYTGQAMVNFGEFGFDTGGIRYGDRTFPLVKKIFFMDGYFDYAHRMSHYTNIKLNESVFSTYVGDLVVDFGPVVAFLIIILFSFVFNKMVSYNGKAIYLYRLIPAYIIGKMLLCGWHLYPFADFGGNLSLFVGFILFFYFKKNKYEIKNNDSY